MKTITCEGKIQKKSEPDDEPILISGEIHCMSSGQVLFDVGEDFYSQVRDKFMLESQPIYGIAEEKYLLVSNGENTMLNASLIKEAIDNKVIIRHQYNGEYEFVGKSSEGDFITATVVDDTTTKPRLMLHQLTIEKIEELPDEKTQVSEESGHENVFWGISDYEILQDLEFKFPVSESNFKVSPLVASENPANISLLKSLTSIEGGTLSEDEKYLYLNSLTLIISFATGIRINTFFNGATIEKTTREIWLGLKPVPKSTGFRVIQAGQFTEFLDKIVDKIEHVDLSEMDLSLSLWWYLQTFQSTILPANFLLLCTAFESLNEAFSKRFSVTSQKAISTSNYRKIRDSALNIIDSELDQLSSVDEDIEKVEIFKKKVHQVFGDGGLNKIGNLGASIGEMLDYYSVSYGDLFNKFDFIGLRNDIIHRGNADFDKTFEAYLKLKNLYYRLVLSILCYEGDFLEHPPLGTGNSPICRSIPFADTSPSSEDG